MHIKHGPRIVAVSFVTLLGTYWVLAIFKVYM